MWGVGHFDVMTAQRYSMADDTPIHTDIVGMCREVWGYPWKEILAPPRAKLWELLVFSAAFAFVVVMFRDSAKQKREEEGDE